MLPGRDHDDDAGLDEAVDFDAERALAAGKPFGLEVVADAHIHAVNEQPAAVAVDLLDMADRGDEIADRALPVLIEHAQAHELALRRHAADGCRAAFPGIRCRRCPFFR